jgi:ribosome-dependent ATPase
MAAIFGTAILTIVPASQYCGLFDPVESLQGAAAVIGRVFPTTYFVTIAQGTFSKGLGLAGLTAAFIPLVIAVLVLLAASTALLKKQAN